MSLKPVVSAFVGFGLIVSGQCVLAATPASSASAGQSAAKADAAGQKATAPKETTQKETAQKETSKEAANDASKDAVVKAAPVAKPQAKDKADSGNLAEVEQQIVDKTNAERAKYGLPPLALDKGLEKTARTHAAWMTNNHTLQHTSQNVGENIAMGQRNSTEAVSAWMASSGHRANILSGSYKRIGVAAYQTTDGTTFWCQQFLP
ncbi:MAG TPA: CAP domain-containing protein [Pirellulales bacterium]|jgi:uncharacterized protein YkwD